MEMDLTTRIIAIVVLILFIQQIMHIVPRSQGGLGVEQNGVLGCQHHHSMLDNGNDGCREEMMQYIEMYMKDKYPGWNRKALIYKKWP